MCPRGVTLLYPEDWMGLALLLASAGNAAFFVIFGLFVVAMIALVVIVVIWAVRHDMAGRAAWRERQARRTPPPGPPGAAP